MILCVFSDICVFSVIFVCFECYSCVFSDTWCFEFNLCVLCVLRALSYPHNIFAGGKVENELSLELPVLTESVVAAVSVAVVADSPRE